MFEPSICAVCQLKLESGQGISIHANPLQHEKMQGWQGPFLCQSCHEKKEAMEGKWRPIGIDDLDGTKIHTVFTTTLFVNANLFFGVYLSVQIHPRQMSSVMLGQA